MMQFSSKPLFSGLSAKTLYERISSFDNLKDLMPDQIVDWKSDGDTCSFEIKGMTKLSLKYSERNPLMNVKIVAVDAPFPVELFIELKADAVAGVNCTTTLSADLNPMLSMLASRPLQHLVDTINTKLVSDLP